MVGSQKYGESRLLCAGGGYCGENHQGNRTDFRTRTLGLLNVCERALADAPSAIGVHDEDHCEEDKDWGAKRRPLMVGGSGRVKGVMGMMRQFVQSALIWHARRSVRHSIRCHF